MILLIHLNHTGGTYEFRVSAENKAGIGGPASPPGPVRLKDQLKGKPPKITEPTLDTTTVLGTQVQKSCNFKML